jgi:hypothetical protein
MMPACNLGMAAAAVTIGAEASGLFGGGRSAIGNDKGKQNNIELKSEFLVQGNNFEFFGSNHNKALNYINSNQNRQEFLMRIFNYNDEALGLVLSSLDGSFSAAKKQELISQIKSLQLMSGINGGAWQHATKETILENALNKTTFTLSQKEELKIIVGKYSELVSKSTNISLETTFINSEIAKRLKSEEEMTTNERAILVFLSTLKHSNFYWKTPK